MRYEKIIVGIGLGGTAALVAAAVLGFGGVRPGEGLELHLALAMAATLGVLLAHVWVLVFLAGTGRGLRRLAADRARGFERPARAFARLRRVRRWAVAAAAAAVGAAAALVLSGGAAFTGSAVMPGGAASMRAHAAAIHAGLFALALVLQLAALAVEWRALRANRALFRVFGSPPHSPDPSPTLEGGEGRPHP